MIEFNYPKHWITCDLNETIMDADEKWDACCGCPHFDYCETKERFRDYSGCALILFTLALIIALIGVGVL